VFEDTSVTVPFAVSLSFPSYRQPLSLSFIELIIDPDTLNHGTPGKPKLPSYDDVERAKVAAIDGLTEMNGSRCLEISSFIMVSL